SSTPRHHRAATERAYGPRRATDDAGVMTTTDTTLARSSTAGAPIRTTAGSRHLDIARTWRGREDDPAWVRPALIGLLLGTGILYLWGLGASGWANTFYSSAAQAGSESWKA